MDNLNNNSKVHYVKVNDNMIINENHIRWIKRMKECLEICTRANECSIQHGETYRICKADNYENYMKLSKYLD